jgi:two-component system, response regulator RegA
MAEPLSVKAGISVLLVEDDETFASVLARALRNRGYDVKSTASVESALAATATWQPAAAIIDLKLTQESGLQLVPTLAERLPGIRIIILTGYGSISTAVQAIKLGASDYLTKPADIEDILTALEGQGAVAVKPAATLVPSLRRLEWEHIQRVLTENQGNVSEAARVLGMHRRTLQRKLAKRPVRK